MFFLQNMENFYVKFLVGLANIHCRIYNQKQVVFSLNKVLIFKEILC